MSLVSLSPCHHFRWLQLDLAVLLELDSPGRGTKWEGWIRVNQIASFDQASPRFAHLRRAATAPCLFQSSSFLQRRRARKSFRSDLTSLTLGWHLKGLASTAANGWGGGWWGPAKRVSVGREGRWEAGDRAQKGWWRARREALAAGVRKRAARCRAEGGANGRRCGVAKASCDARKRGGSREVRKAETANEMRSSGERWAAGSRAVGRFLAAENGAGAGGGGWCVSNSNRRCETAPGFCCACLENACRRAWGECDLLSHRDTGWTYSAAISRLPTVERPCGSIGGRMWVGTQRAPRPALLTLERPLPGGKVRVYGNASPWLFRQSRAHIPAGVALAQRPARAAKASLKRAGEASLMCFRIAN